MSSNQRRQIMQPWPLCLVPFAKPKERNILPNYYTRVPSIGRSSTTSSRIALDCSSNTTLVTNASPFNSQTALIAEKKSSSRGCSVNPPTNHYYAENLRNNHRKGGHLNGSRIYDPLDRGIDADYKQLDPLLSKDEKQQHQYQQEQEQQRQQRPSMDSQDPKSPKEGHEEAPATPSSCAPPSQFQKVEKPSAKRFAKQVVAALSVSLGSMIVGYSTSYTSPALDSMMSNASVTNFEVTQQTGMWIGSIMPLSALFGGIFGGPSIEYFGRRNTILATGIPFLGAWLLIALASSLPMILAGRALCGFCVGVASLSLPVYLGETIQPEVRGTLGLLPTVFGNSGILLCFTAGMYLNWRNLALLGATLPVPFMLLMLMIPETPRWYISKGKTKKARKALQWLRGRETDITEELTSVEQLHIESERSAPQSTLQELLKKKHLKPLLISLGLMFFQQMSGINAVIFYTVQIFADAGSSVDKNIATIIVGVVNFISTFVAATVIDRLGRKILLYASSVAMIVTLFSLGTYFYLRHAKVDVSSFGWIPLVSLMVYVIGFSLGFGPIPWLMMGEILPARIRGPAASIATAFNWMCTFTVTKTYGDMIQLIHSFGTFWIFSAICVFGFVFVRICVPETSGSSLEEIEKRFTGPVRRMSAVANMKPMPTAC